MDSHPGLGFLRSPGPQVHGRRPKPASTGVLAEEERPYYTFSVINYDDWHWVRRVMEFEGIQYIASFPPTFGAQSG